MTDTGLPHAPGTPRRAVVAARTDLDAVLHLGDYIYEYGHGEYPAEKYTVRSVQPEHETVSLADYRTRHAHYKLGAEHAQVDHWVLSDKAGKETTAEVRRSCRIRSGTQTVERAERPL